MINFICEKMPKIVTLRDGTNEITFNVKKLNLSEFDALERKTIKVEVKEFKPKRSISQNSYMWVLINEISEKLNISTDDCYHKFIHEYGVRNYLMMKNEAIDRFVKEWEAKGLGNFVEDLQESKIDGCTKLAVFYGSSSYDSKEMARLIDGVVQECEQLGISTLTRAEILMLDNSNDRRT